MVGTEQHTFAVRYLEMGLSVIPLKRDKKPYIPWAKYQKERPTGKDIDHWFTQWPDANIGIVTGEISGIAVVDFDSQEAFADTQLKYGIPNSPLVKTGRGYHLYCKYSPDVGNFQKRDDLPEIDLRSQGGYVVAPPSIHENGTVYQWVNGYNLSDLADLPEYVLVKNKSQKDSIKKLYTGVSQGKRNNSLARLTGSWAKDGLSIEECFKNAQIWNSKNDFPLPDSELLKTVESIVNRHLSGKNKKETLSHNEIATLIQEKRKLIYCGEDFYQYKEGYYQKQNINEVRRWIKGIIKDNFTTHWSKEVIHSLSTDCYTDVKLLNANKKHINLKNGILDLETFQLAPHNPNILTSIQLPINYNPAAQCPLWLKTLDEIFLGNQNKINILQEFMGYSITADTSKEKALFSVERQAAMNQAQQHYFRILLQILNNWGLVFLPGRGVNCIL